MEKYKLKKDSWLFIIILLVTIGTGVLLFYSINSQRDDAVLIDIAGRQRMLSQRIGLLANQIARGNANTIPILEQHMELFERSLLLLEVGGNVTTVGMEQDIVAHSAPVDVQHKIINARNTWKIYQDLLVEITNNDVTNYETLLERIDEIAIASLEKNDAVVKAFVNHAEQTQNSLAIMLLTLLALNSIIIVVGLLLISIELPHKK